MALLCVTFSMTYGQFSTIGIIGSGTPVGWGEDTDMTPNADSTIWTIQLELVRAADGMSEVKFRANDSYDSEGNWGGEGFPYGTLLNDAADGQSPNIPTYPGLYDITLDLNTNTYSFQVISDVAIIGEATPNGWNDPDTDMIPYEDGSNKYWTVIDLTANEFKFRTFNNWDSLNYTGVWGEPDLTEGGGNIACPQAGNYRIEVDLDNLTWSAEENKRFETIGIIGSATPGGWDTDTPMSQDANDPNVWVDTLGLVDGAAKFRADGMWAVQWGSLDFPAGNGTGGADDIPITAGDYLITLNTETGDYNFRAYELFENVGIIGVNGNFDTPVLMEDVSGLGTDYRVRTDMGDDNLQFVGFDDAQTNVVILGAGTFPTGTANVDGPTIPTAAGEYFVNFSTVTGRYSFEEIIEYDAISITGNSGPFLSWPSDGDGGAADFFLTQDASNGDLWTGTGAELIDFDAAADGGLKFRADTAWTVNWGAVDFPMGMGTFDGPNIEPVAGVYDISFNSASGEYVFVESLSTTEQFQPADVAVYPNPAQTLVNVDLSALPASDNVRILIYTTTGKLVQNEKVSTQQVTLDVSELSTGAYFMQINSETYMIGKRFTVAK